MVSSDNCEVAIVGAGPVGLCLALLLGHKGIKVFVADKADSISRELRASTFHPPTLDMLDDFGLAAPLIKQGLISPEWQIRLHPAGDRVIFDLSILSSDTRHPYRLQCEQWKLSLALLAALRTQASVQVTFGTRCAGFVQDEDGVSAQFVDGDGRETTVTSRFLVGADGAHSIVRQLAGIEFSGQTYPETTLLVTTRFPFEQHLEDLSNVTYCWADNSNFSLLRVPGRWRVSLYPREDQPLDAQMAPDNLEAGLQAIVPTNAEYDVLETRPYRVHQRIVSSYVQGRIALVGDAAHLNAPSGGMGLNGGLHDAFELSAAFIDLLAGAPLDRLHLYDQRRRPIAREQINAQADANRSRMRERSPELRREILDGLQAIAADRKRLHKHLLRTSMIEGLRASRAYQ